MASISTRTAVSGIRGSELMMLAVPVPPASSQYKIISILSAYDDLIENNLRRIQILEEMAQNLYREWFVKFRFPGHESVRMVDSELGEIPEGWEIVRFEELLECVRDHTKRGAHLSDRHYLPIDCLPRKSLQVSEVKPWQEAKSSLITFERGDILFGAMRSYFHKVVVAPFKGVTRTTCFVLRPRQADHQAFTALLTFQDDTVAFANSHSRGATIPYAVWEGALADYLVVRPKLALIKQFGKHVNPLIRRIQLAYPLLNKLRETRDLLLPRLISGEVDVSDLDITVPEEAA